MCIPKDSYADENNSEEKITIKDFYGEKLNITFMNDPSGGIDKFDADVIDMARDIVKSSFPSYYRKEFKLLSTKGDISLYRSVISAKRSSGEWLQESIYYVRMNGNKIRGHDFMSVSGPLVKQSDDETYQIIIELGMLKHLKVY